MHALMYVYIRICIYTYSNISICYIYTHAHRKHCCTFPFGFTQKSAQIIVMSTKS